MENNLPVLKVYEIDYSFIIKNYLNPELWTKTWTLFQYKEFIFTLNIERIYCKDERIMFNIRLEDTINHEKYRTDYWTNYPYRAEGEVDYSLKIDNIKLLKKKIYSKMITVVNFLEQRFCKCTDEYREMEYAKETEKDTLRQIAEDFLDENRVYNDDIREVYIENYIDNNSIIDGKLRRYLESKEYKLLTDLYLILAEVNNDKNLKETILDKVEDAENILEEVREHLERLETEEYQDELAGELEDI